MSNLIKLSSSNFESEISGGSDVLVDFYADWCMPCKAMAPILEKVAEQRSIKVGKVDADSEAALLSKYSIGALPTLVLFRNGQVAGKLVGFQNQDVINKLLDS